MGKKSRRVRNGGRLRQQQQQQQLPPSPPPAIPRPPPTVDHHHHCAVVVSAENRSRGESDREKLNRLMHEFKSLPSSDPWDVNRIQTMALYYSTIKDNLNVVLDEDYKFLQAIGRSLTETALSRSFAWLVLGFLHFLCCQESTDVGVIDPRGKTVQYYDAAVAAIDSMSTADKERPVIGEIVTVIQETSLRWLEICAGATQNQWNRSTQLPALVAGLYCDGCMKPRDEILKVCGDCRKAHYCGQACQRQAWNNGHKLFCRKTGEFRVGDVALTKDPFASINYCHSTTPVGDRVHGRWREWEQDH
jgi:MYND finger